MVFRKMWLLFLIVPFSCAAQQKYSIYFGKHRLLVEVARNRAERAKGLMYRRHLAKNSGMLFLFPVAGRYCFWMKNTYVPLSIVFIDKNNRIVHRAHMYPHNLQPVCTPKPALFVVEAAQGWFESRGIGVGSLVYFDKKVKKIVAKMRPDR